MPLGKNFFRVFLGAHASSFQRARCQTPLARWKRALPGTTSAHSASLFRKCVESWQRSRVYAALSSTSSTFEVPSDSERNVKDALSPKGPAVRSPGREAGGIGVISMSAEGAAQWECRALRPSDYGSRSSPPSRAGLFTAGPSALAQPVPSGSWCKQNNIFMCLGVRRTCKTAVRFFLVAAEQLCAHRWFYFVR